MKKHKYTGLALTLSLAAVLGGCQADMDTPALDVPVATLQPNTRILELKEAFENKTEKVGYKPGTEVYDESGELIGGERYIIHGRVVSSDASGNIYKSLVIQDETAALAFSINQGSLYNEYRLGQDVVVDLTGLYIGYYRGLQQVGSPGEAYNGQPQLGFMAYDYWLSNSELNGLPNPEFRQVSLGSDYPEDEFYCISFNNFDELNNATLPELQSQLVEFRNVSFRIAEGEETFAPYQESVNRTLVDANGKTLTVRNSGYSNFYHKEIPTGKGIVRGILSYYGDSWQLVLRDLRDVMISDKGEVDKPYTTSEILSGDYAGMTGWSEGYIVGSVKAGVTVVSGAEDVIFGAGAEMDNNVLIAESADETDVTRCAIVELPQNTLLRYYVNLPDNPEVYKKRLSVYGTLGETLGMKGVTDSRGGKEDFLIDGKTIEENIDVPEPAGSGTESDPYNISYVMQSEADQEGVWVTGYVAGYVVSGDFGENSVEFSSSEVSGSTNYLNSTNVVLSAVAPMKCGVANSVPCQLTAASRPTLGLRLNPAIFGKQVRIKCQITTYLGVRGIRKITEVVEL